MGVELVFQGVKGAVELILSANPDVAEIAARSVRVSGIATLMALTWSLPAGLALGLYRFRGRSLVRSLFNGMLGIPTVVLGLILYLLLVPSGPLGFLGLIYTEMGISFGQSLLITPIIVSFITTSIESVEREVSELAKTLGAGKLEASITVMREAMAGVVLSLIAAFNRAVAELGVAIMIGGNVFVKGSALNTRVLTTAIQMYTSRGELEMAIALGIILLLIVLSITVILNFLQARFT